MENYSKIIDNVCNGEKSRQHIRKIIPILVYWAQHGETTHTYGDLTYELFGHRQYSGIGKQLEYVVRVLTEVEKATHEPIPTLNGLCTPMSSALPSEGFQFACPEYAGMDSSEKQAFVERKNREATGYTKWDWVLNILGLNPYRGNMDGIFPNEVDEKDLWEGHASRVYVNRYERSAEARKKCIALKGCTCFVCGMDFGKKYGAAGHGFIHIHHMIPLSAIGKAYQIDFQKDLVPVCPNCHAMLH